MRIFELIPTGAAVYQLICPRCKPRSVLTRHSGDAFLYCPLCYHVFNVDVDQRSFENSWSIDIMVVDITPVEGK